MAKEREASGVVVVERGSGVGAFILGALVGAAVALLVAPRSGAETRRLLKAKGRDLMSAAGEKAEELRELAQARSDEERREELGDLLFMVVRAASELNIDAEAALRQANRKIRRRFRRMEELARSEGRPLEERSREELRVLWRRAKEQADAVPDA